MISINIAEQYRDNGLHRKHQKNYLICIYSHSKHTGAKKKMWLMQFLPFFSFSKHKKKTIYI